MSSAREEELAALRRPFAIGVGCVLLAVAALGLVIARFGTGADRPAGIAERWLVAVGDTTREGIEADAQDRVEENGISVEEALESFPDLLPERAAADGERAFESVRVGRMSTPEPGVVTSVPFEVVQYEGATVAGYVQLSELDEGWEVVHLQPLGDTLCVDPEACGFPIERPERAPLGWFAGALALGVLITLGCMAAVRAATPKPT